MLDEDIRSFAARLFCSVNKTNSVLFSILPDKPLDKPWSENVGSLHELLTYTPRSGICDSEKDNNYLEVTKLRLSFN